jgi:bifunctional non-homologous end joining protein LigD
MLAHPIPKGKDLEIKPGEWAAEEKYDGMRLIVEVGSGKQDLFIEEGVTSWSRYGLLHPLPGHLQEAMSVLPPGLYDGELLVPGLRSYGSARLENREELVLYLFDILRIEHTDTTPHPYWKRREYLQALMLRDNKHEKLRLANSQEVHSWDDVYSLRDQVWTRDGEGLILKRVEAPYVVGKRSKDFIKIKKLQSAVLTVIGFEPSRGLINNRGRYAMVLLVDDEGNKTTVKTKNDAWCRKFEEAGARVEGPHPYIGKRLMVEYQERTPDKSYRHIRWDRWEDE